MSESANPEKALIITLDGPAGSGKSTVARLLAKRLGLEFLDTGAMYRGLAAAAIDAGIDPGEDEAGVVNVAITYPIRFDWTADPPRLKVGGRDLTHRLRDPDTTGHVSHVASMPEVRRVLVEAQRRIGREHQRLVTEGRDQGSVVFPQAQAKFYMDASADVRAKRRVEQLEAAGRVAKHSVVLAQIIDRDHRDTTREDGPLICPEDAERLDTSGMSLEAVVDHLEARVRERVGQQQAERDGGAGVDGASGGTAEDVLKSEVTERSV